MRNNFNFLFLFFVTVQLSAQVHGVLSDESGEPLPYASVYVNGSSYGTATNQDGKYSLNLENGEYELVYQYVGFETVYRKITFSEVHELNVTLPVQSIGISEVVIAADAEDPAYPIIRKAISKRNYYRDLIPAYDADVYIKGSIKMTDAPKSIFGEEVGNLDGLLDTSRQGIIYLTESQSKVYWESPGKMKEVMYATKTSGDNNGIELNNLSFAYFDFYKERIKFERDIISPIADDAFSYYKYRLEGSFYTEDGQEINKIKIIPKDDFRPVIYGYIYIVEDKWNIHSINAFVTGKSMKAFAYDTIQIRQVFVPIQHEQYKGRHLFSQVLSFKSSFWGFKVGGAFTYIFKDYNIQEQLPEGTINNEIFIVEEEAEKDNEYWLTERPIPLTTEEVSGYEKRDSLVILWESKPYLDSIDRDNNKFSFWNILTGYDYQNSFNKSTYQFSGILNMASFNAVEGLRLAPKFEYEYFNPKTSDVFKVSSTYAYGFSDKKSKAAAELYYRFDNKSNSYLRFEGGRRYSQIDERNPVPQLFNTFYSLIEKRHRYNLFQKDYIKLTLNREWLNGLFMNNSIEYAHRNSLDVNTDYSWFNDDRIYGSNNINFSPVKQDEILLFKTRVVWYPGLKYFNFPTYKIRHSSDWPAFSASFATTLFDSNSDRAQYTKASVSIFDRKVRAGIIGFSRYHLTGGGFINSIKVNVMDLFIPITNNFHLNFKERYFNGFKFMPYYKYQTQSNYFSGIYEHHFDGYIFDKIPGMRSVGAKSIVGYGQLKSGELDYKEISFGIENIQIFGPAFFRVDYIWNWDNNEFSDHGFVFSIAINN